MGETNCSWDDVLVDNQSYQMWPQWLPHDWSIHRSIGTPDDNQVSYSNPKGKIFYTMEEVVEFLAKEAKKPVPKRTKRKITKLNEKTEEKKSENATQVIAANPPQDWPDWLPIDWCIERSCEIPTTVYYCSPKWKRFQTKDEVLNHLNIKAKKKKPNIAKRKNSNIEGKKKNPRMKENNKV